MEGSWGSWENELLGNTIINLVKENKNLEIAIRFSEFKNESKDIDLQNLLNFGEFLIVFLIKTLQKNPIFRNKFI